MRETKRKLTVDDMRRVTLVADSVAVHARKHYGESAWDVVVECWTFKELSDWAEKNDIKTPEDGIKLMKIIVGVWEERRANAEKEVF